MQPVNSPQKVVSFISPPQGKASAPSIPELPSQQVPASSPNASSQVTEPAHSSRLTQVLLSTVAIAVGMTVVAGATFVTGSFVLAQLETQQRSPQRSVVEPTQQKVGQNRQVTLDAERLPQAPSSLADAPAKMQLDRAARLAVSGNFKAAIASASGIQPSSPSYEAAQQAIEQWSDKLLQLAERLYAERKLSAAFAQVRAVPETSAAFPEAQQLLQQWKEKQQAEQDANQQHLQSAQQALRQGDGLTAMQEAEQMTDAPGWQAQKAAIMRKAQPLANLQRANQLVEQGEPENAIYEANLLPSAAPWIEKRNLLIEKANQMIADKTADTKWRETCQALTDGYISQCPHLTDLLSSLGKGSSSQRYVKPRKH